jgi:hypothetical protein
MLKTAERYIEVLSKPLLDFMVTHLSANTNLGFYQIVRTTVITNVNHCITSCFVGRLASANRRKAS